MLSQNFHDSLLELFHQDPTVKQWGQHSFHLCNNKRYYFGTKSCYKKGSEGTKYDLLNEINHLKRNDRQVRLFYLSSNIPFWQDFYLTFVILSVLKKAMSTANENQMIQISCNEPTPISADHEVHIRIKLEVQHWMTHEIFQEYGLHDPHVCFTLQCNFK